MPERDPVRPLLGKHLLPWAPNVVLVLEGSVRGDSEVPPRPWHRLDALLGLHVEVIGYILVGEDQVLVISAAA